MLDASTNATHFLSSNRHRNGERESKRQHRAVVSSVWHFFRLLIAIIPLMWVLFCKVCYAFNYAVDGCDNVGKGGISLLTMQHNSHMPWHWSTYTSKYHCYKCACLSIIFGIHLIDICGSLLVSADQNPRHHLLHSLRIFYAVDVIARVRASHLYVGIVL